MKRAFVVLKLNSGCPALRFSIVDLTFTPRGRRAVTEEMSGSESPVWESISSFAFLFGADTGKAVVHHHEGGEEPHEK